MYTTVLFDLDGTLLDTLKDLANAGNATLIKMGLPKHPIEAYKKMVGNGIPKLVERMLPEQNRGKSTVEIATNLFMKYYTEHMRDFTTPYKGIVELLQILKDENIQIAVVSNKSDAFVTEVVEEYFPNIFEHTIGYQDEMPPKPAPDMVEHIMQQLGAKKQTTLFCGDSNVDIQTAKNAQLKSCGVLWGFRDKEELEREGATYTVKDTNELKKIILEK